MSTVSALGALGGGFNAAAAKGVPAVPPVPTVPTAVYPSGGLPNPAGAPTAQKVPPAGVVPAPDKVARAEWGSTPAPGSPYAPTGLPAPAPAAAGQPASDSWPGYIKGMVQGLQDKFGEMQNMMSAPVSVPDFPGGEELARTMQESLRAQWSMVQLEVGMAQADQVRGTAKAVTDKITEMKD